MGSLQCDGSSSLVLIFSHVQYSGRIAAFSTQVFTTKFSNQDCSVLKSFNTASTPPLMCCLILPWPWFAMAWMHVFRSGIHLEWWRRWRSSIGCGPRPIEEKETVETETERGSDNNCRQVQERPFAETTIKSMSLCSEDLPPAILGEGEVCWVLSVYSRLVWASQSRPRPNCNLKPYDNLFTSLAVARLTVPQLLYSHFSDSIRPSTASGFCWQKLEMSSKLLGSCFHCRLAGVRGSPCMPWATCLGFRTVT